MTVMKIVEWPEKVLETKALPVTFFDDEFRKFVADMVETMHASRGIGLAANQVGVLKRVCVVKIENLASEDGSHKKIPGISNAPYPWEGKLFVLVNPVIHRREGKITYDEGCLSFPELYEEVDRSRNIIVKYQDEFGQQQMLEANDLLAVCIQHELDHLDGIVFVNRLEGRNSNRAKERFKKLQHQRKLKQTAPAQKNQTEPLHNL